ncbi:MAG: squalene synthase HpnC [Bacteroidetes bacterium]|nr:squalene synthase HpnC [Bacteroidota bacterium]MBU1115505.1 squalene synthase HpnC [Bacteroidota bacterium]MBU1799557.1 squalene synthase HpnC [Bacteroidota bacterium]
MNNNFDMDSAYNNAIKFTKLHYENFPVLSFLVPKKLQKHVAIIYQFAREADDIADEGNKSVTQRIELLNSYETAFKNSLNGIFEKSFWMALSNTIETQNLTSIYFSNLLIAFRQDITQTRYSTFEDLLHYCTHSANPVGRIILELNKITNNEAFYFSDKICTALQITNFLQDVSIDFNKGRIYLPIAEMKKFGVTENIFLLKKINSNFQNLMEAQVQQVFEYFNEGKKLLPFLPFRLKHQIKWTINGGEEILKKIVKLDYNVLTLRPKFSKLDLLKLLS